MHVRLFGKLALSREGSEITRFPTRHAGKLLAYLAYHPARAHPRELLAEVLWPGGNPRAVRLRLNQTVSEVRRVASPDDPFLSDRLTLQLRPGLSSDVQRFLGKLNEAKQTNNHDERIVLLREATHCADGEFLPGCLDDWVLEAREALNEARHEALLELAQLLESRDPGEAINVAEQALAANRYSDRAEALLLRNLLKLDRNAEAAKRYWAYCSRLREDFAIDPGAEVSATMRHHVKVEGKSASERLSTPKTERPSIRQDAALEEGVLDTYIRLGDAERALRLASLLVQHWNLAGTMRSGYRSLRRALAMPEAIFASADAKASALVGLAAVTMSLGRSSESSEALKSALSLSNGVADKKVMAEANRWYGTLLIKQGRHREAEGRFANSVEICRRLGDKGIIADALTGLGEALRFQGELNGAESATREARSLRIEIGRPDRAAQSALNLGILASRRGDRASALSLLHESLSQARHGSPTVIADCLMEIAGICGEARDGRTAATLLAAAVALRKRVLAPLPIGEREDYVRFLRVARKSLPRERFDFAWAEGASATLDASIELALSISQTVL